jgi:cation:H+ antiporter
VALATSLPELVSCIAAARIGAINLAIGNVFGSNTFNLLLLIPLDVAHPGPIIAAIEPIHLLTCLFVVLITSIVIIGQLYRVESRILLIEPDALLVLLLVTASLVLIYYCK